MKTYLVREKVIDITRKYFKDLGFREVSTPLLVPIPSAESNLEVFKTELKTYSGEKRNAYLIMSPEYSIKKLLAAGIGSCFEITKCFRNEENVTSLHNHEFTMLEWYRVGANYKKVMEDFEDLFIYIIKGTRDKTNLKKWKYQDRFYDISKPWIRIKVKDAFRKYAGIDTKTLLSKSKLLAKAKSLGYIVDSNTTWEQVFYQILFNKIEPEFKKIKKPVILYEYPLSQAALAKRSDKDQRFAERFEVYLAGVELGNAFSELTDPIEQEKRLNKEIKLRKKLKKSEYGIDREFIHALKSGLPKVAGIAVGLDRLVMLAADVPTVSDTLFFPSKEIFDLEED